MDRFASQVREVVNRNAFVSVALAEGFNAFLPVYDGGIDLILHREADAASRLVQLKGRWTIDKKYVGRDIWVAFPIDGEWHLVPHDEMVRHATANGTLETASWREKGTYHRGRPSKTLVSACRPYRLRSVAAVTTEAADGERSGIDSGPAPSRGERVAGSLLGGAVGDALGAPVELLSLDDIRGRFGPEGLTGWEPFHGRIGTVTDDTQMTMFTAEGLLRARMRAQEKGICHIPSVIHHAYLRWLATQGEVPTTFRETEGPDGWLYGIEALHQRRGPGRTCLAALAATEGYGAPAVAHNASKGSGGVMRVAPVGLVAQALGDDAEVFKMATEAAALTHGHPSGHLAAGHFAVVIAAMVRGEALATGIDVANRFLADREDGAEVLRAVAAARALAGRGRPTPEALEGLGGGHVAEEALAIALCCALTALDFEDGVLLAANHSGDSDSTASMTGNLLGAMWGVEAIPPHLADEVEMRPEILRLAADVETACSGEGLRWDDYPGW